MCGIRARSRSSSSRYAIAVGRGEALGPDVSVLKIWATETFQRIARLMIEVAGPYGGMYPTGPHGTALTNALAVYYNALPSTIYGGSSEIQRNTVATRVLHLGAASRSSADAGEKER
jgi:alkylation response protein AidB-like acyl-CoA dehydrogenase